MQLDRPKPLWPFLALMPVAASIASGGTECSPETLLRTRMSRVYVVSGMDRGQQREAEDRSHDGEGGDVGIVYRMPLMAVIGP